tara:strand:- start:52471 stop:53523 length:1053 start_codon:yes stop_codon:yes gene_type:complete
MINKLDPRQYNPYALNTPSGNLSFEEGVDFFNCNLLENLTGDFNITGSLQVNNGKVIFSDSSNLIQDNNNSVINSISASVSGSNNTLINSNQSVLLGNNNTILGGEQNRITDSDDSAIIFGSNVLNQNTGSAIIADGNSVRPKESVRDNALTIDFSSGAFVLNDLFVDGSVYLSGNTEVSDGSFTVKEGHSGIFEGGICVSGESYLKGPSYLSGSPIQNLQTLLEASGQLNHTATGISGSYFEPLEATGALFELNLRSTGAILGSLIESTGVSLSSIIESTGVSSTNHTNNLSGILSDEFYVDKLILDTGRTIPTNFDSAGISGELSFDHQYFYICTGDSAWARILLGWS